MTTDFKTTDSPNVADAQRCPGCGALNGCAMARGEQQCWCMAEPLGVALPTSPAVSNSADASCYCRDCLRTLSASLQNKPASTHQTKE